MRGLPTGWPGRVLALLILLVAAAVLSLGVASPLMNLYRDRTDMLAERRALADKMAAVAATLPAREAEAAVQAKGAPPVHLLLAGATDALAAAQLQESLEKAAATTGITLLSTEGVPTRAVGKLRRVGLKLGLSGKYAALVNFLGSVDRAAAPLLVDDLSIQGSSIPSDADEPVLIGLTVYGFRAGDKS